MKIAVCLKQVPDTADIKWTSENNIAREGLSSILNPCDDFAIQLALDMNTEVTAVSMGPTQAKTVLEYALARGCENAILLNDRKFVGSDTLATSKVLSHVLKDFNFIFCSNTAIDGETGQTPPSVAKLLGYEFISSVTKIVSSECGKIILEQKTPSGVNTICALLPLVVSVVEGDFEPPLPLIGDYIEASKKEIKILGATDIGIDKDMCGIKGSPTIVNKVFRPTINRKCQEVHENYRDFILNLVQETRGAN